MAAILAAAACAVILALSDGPAGLAISRHDLLACSVMGIVQIGCGLVAFTAGSRHLPAADLALLAQTEVVLAPVWAWLVVGEVPAFDSHRRAWCGGVAAGLAARAVTPCKHLNRGGDDPLVLGAADDGLLTPIGNRA